ncbi:22450_t:CDS:2 [Dentiscutata erythropus]|uniref:22450_t:CDS:1 n=1 Tax=Dentiscutata erythropus TaxID=1348616 RepID=A0A9N9JGW9_9GLOM|nr:22450_t:CDS:2 [Dentiscutata erythropus]
MRQLWNREYMGNDRYKFYNIYDQSIVLKSIEYWGVEEIGELYPSEDSDNINQFFELEQPEFDDE